MSKESIRKTFLQRIRKNFDPGSLDDTKFAELVHEHGDGEIDASLIHGDNPGNTEALTGIVTEETYSKNPGILDKAKEEGRDVVKKRTKVFIGVGVAAAIVGTGAVVLYRALKKPSEIMIDERKNEKLME